MVAKHASKNTRMDYFELMVSRLSGEVNLR